ncbi:MAG: hypothetical protein QM784_23940 [Polyangiaceae bacterium]
MSISVDRRLGRMGAVQRALVDAGFTSPTLLLGRSRLMFVVSASASDEADLRRRLLEASAGTLLDLDIGRPFSGGRALLLDGFRDCPRNVEAFS